MGPHLQRGLHQPSNRPVHRLPIIGTAIQSVEQNEEIDALAIALGIPIHEQSVDSLRLVIHVVHALRPRTARP